MHLGLFMMPMHPPAKDRTECFEEDLELVVRADELGYTEAWIGQHHSVEWESIPANDLFIAHALPRTKQIRFGTGVTLVPLHHPTNIATRLAMLDHLARGRLYCGFGQSGIATDLSLFDLPTDPQTLGLMTMEGIDMVLKLWQTEPPFDFQGKFWHIHIDRVDPEIRRGYILQPYQKPHPPVAMSVMKGNSLAARTAGQRGYMPLSTNLVPSTTLAQHWQTYCAGAAEAGQPAPSRACWRVARNIFVGRTNAEALDYAMNSAFAGSWHYLLKMIGPGAREPLKDDPEMPDEAVTVEYCVKKLSIVGDIDECTRRLHEVWDHSGGFGTLLMIGHDWDDREKWLRSIEWLKNEIVPTLPSI
ncbi:MAG: LLM class flavin-dependent oxidoreductase [Caldilineaceae bacterium]